MTFKPGTSGCPSGRPKGIFDKRTELRRQLESSAPELVTKLIEMAKAGEPNAMRMVIERLIPRAKPDDTIHFELPEGRLDAPDNMLQIAHDITSAVALGQLSMDEAEKFTCFIKQQRRIVEDAEYKKKREIEEAKYKEDWEKRLKLAKENNGES